jgi:lipid II:glycine glycyltransferase (peptidoglycan interpeptide bridge formation enzyme)
MPVAICEEGEDTVARSPYGGSYGGIVTDTGLPFRYARRMVSSMIEYFEDTEVDKIRIRPTPREQMPDPSCNLEYHYIDKGFEIVDKEVTNVINLGLFEDDPFDIYTRSCRSKVRKSKDEGVTVEEWSDDWESFHEILSETWERHGKTPTHTLDELKDLESRFPDRIKLCIAYYEDEPVAGICEFLISPRINFHFYNCHREEYRDLAPVNLLIDKELRWSKENGYELFDFGTSVENFEPKDGLIKFKEGFGSTGNFRNLYEYIF